MRSALAKVEGVSESNIEIDNTDKTATVSFDKQPSPQLVQALVDALKGTKFSATVEA